MQANAAELRKLQPEEFHRRFLRDGVRPDGRQLLQARTAALEFGIVTSAISSALVTLGNTRVVVGVKADITAPHERTPTSGKLEVAVELSPLCSPEFKLGRPSERATAMGSMLTRLLLESRVVDLTSLCVKEGTAVWQLHVDVLCLNDAGNVVDAAVIAIDACLPRVKLPVVSLNDDGDLETDVDSAGVVLVPQRRLLPATFAVLDSKLLLDPSNEEEELMSHGITVVSDEAGNVCCVHKHHSKACNMSDVQHCIELARTRHDAVAMLANNASGSGGSGSGP